MVKFIDENLHRYSHIDSVKEAIQIRLHLNNINRDNRINTNAYNQTSTAQQLIGTRANCWGNSFPILWWKDASHRNPPTITEVQDTPSTNNHGGTDSLTCNLINRYYRLMNTRSTQRKIQGEGPKYRDPPPSPSDLTLVWYRNSYIYRILYYLWNGWFFSFLMKRTLHFATKLYVSQHTSLLIIGCTLPVSSFQSEPSFSGN